MVLETAKRPRQLSFGRVRTAMTTLLVIGGVTLATLWILQTVVYWVGYRRELKSGT